ncbi:MAG: hypothetical protein IJC53_04325 [Clostridia bacterium]|nr:hypothetical protein [Clostridia bacterium]
MKNWVKYLIGMVVFGLVYALILYLFKSLGWKMVVGASIIYGVLNMVFDRIANKTTKKK